MYYYLSARLQRPAPHVVIIPARTPWPCVLPIPRADLVVLVARAHAEGAHQPRGPREGTHVRPVARGRAIRKPICSEVGVKPAGICTVAVESRGHAVGVYQSSTQ